ncbi:hypothetical protein GQR58_030365 [Nymphon striatum]|nr:hypothetical protein GQR58_030365 [Nymphon striatum]
MLILSGVDELTEYVSEEEQLSYLLRPVAFDEIRPTNTVDLKEISDLCHLYAGKVGIDFPEKLWTSDFTKRLVFCSANRWGLLIELVIDALKIAHFNDAAQVDTEHFCKSFTDRTGFAAGHSPVSIEYYEEAFDAQKILDMVRRAEVANQSKVRKTTIEDFSTSIRTQNLHSYALMTAFATAFENHGAVSVSDVVFFTSQDEFSNWLEGHPDASEVWVGYHRKSTNRPSLTWSETVDVALWFGWIDGVRKSIDDQSYKIRFTPRKLNSVWSAVNVTKVQEFISLGLMKPAGLHVYNNRSDVKGLHVG